MRLAAVLGVLAWAAPGTAEDTDPSADPGNAAGAVAAAPPYTDAVPSGPSVDERLAEIARRVQAVLHYPPMARARGLAGNALVAFTIRADGEPEQVRTRRSSGSPLLDRAAERAVRDAAPLPRVHGTVAVPVRFELSADE